MLLSFIDPCTTTSLVKTQTLNHAYQFINFDNDVPALSLQINKLADTTNNLYNSGAQNSICYSQSLSISGQNSLTVQSTVETNSDLSFTVTLGVTDITRSGDN